MHKRIRDLVIDDLMETYVDWREASAEVESAHRRWSIAPSPDTALAFAAYVAALDREELASILYAAVVRRTYFLIGRDRRRRLTALQRRAGRRRSSRRRGRTPPFRREPGSRTGGTGRGRGAVRSGGGGRSGRRAA
jgi:uncharacterized membrane protein YgcG